LQELTERKQALEDALETDRARDGQLSRQELAERSSELGRVDYELRRARRTATVEARRTVEGLARVLERYDYLRDGRPTAKAAYLRSLFDTNALTLCELLTNQQLEGLEPPELAEALSWFATDRDAAVRGLPLTRRLHRLREILDVLHGGVLREEERHGLQMSRALPVDFHGVALAWAEGQDLASIGQRARMQEGDLVGALQKTLDLVGQLRGAALKGALGTALIPLLDGADALLRRGVVSASYQWAIGGLPDADQDLDGDWDVHVLPEDEPGPFSPRPRDRRPGRRPPAGGPRRARSKLDVTRSKTVRAGPKSAIKPRKKR
jgi:superfamily II RNA helicase